MTHNDSQVEAVMALVERYAAEREEVAVEAHAFSGDSWMNKLAAADATLAELRTALSALAAGKVEASWQPIATAPAGGGDMLLWWKGRGAGRGRWQCDESGEGWKLDGDQVIPAKKYQRDCTHWMPLPASPSPLSADPESALVGAATGGQSCES